MGFLASLPNVQFKRQSINFFGRDCFLQQWSLHDKLEIRRFLKDETNDVEVKAMIVGLMLALCDEQGNKLCSLDDYESFLKLPQKELIDYAMTVAELNKLPSTDDIEKN